MALIHRAPRARSHKQGDSTFAQERSFGTFSRTFTLPRPRKCS